MRYLSRLPLPFVLAVVLPIGTSAILWLVRRRRVSRYLVVACVLAWIFSAIYFAWLVLDHYQIPSRQPLVLILGAASILSILILWKIPQWQVRGLGTLEPTARFTSENEARKTIAQIIAGVAILGGFYSAQRQLAVTQEGQITERYSKAIEQLGATDTLGHKRLELRLGSIYALERIARDSEQDHWPIMEILTAYVRQNSPRGDARQSAAEPGANGPARPPEEDIQAIMTVIGRRQTGRDFERGKQLDLSGTDLRNLNLRPAVPILNNPREVNLDFALLSDANLEGADLSFARMIGAKFSGTRLKNVKFQNADLSRAIFSHADLEGADFLGAILANALFLSCNLKGANMRYVEGISQDEIQKLLLNNTVVEEQRLPGKKNATPSAKPR